MSHETTLHEDENAPDYMSDKVNIKMDTATPLWILAAVFFWICFEIMIASTDAVHPPGGGLPSSCADPLVKPK